jgi:hypothetical protein
MDEEKFRLSLWEFATLKKPKPDIPKIPKIALGNFPILS